MYLLLLVQEHGLKHGFISLRLSKCELLLVQERGLKQR
ncbi:hypothetical protein BLGI_4756 [Brevibacillus laterosporus GI-9]|nr:hypothetical protein BLGI_4756 [Brevibacillus laterosporus GI-9]